MSHYWECDRCGRRFTKAEGTMKSVRVEGASSESGAAREVLQRDFCYVCYGRAWSAVDTALREANDAGD